MKVLFHFFNGSIPGVKLGLANAVILLVIYKYSFKDAFSVSVLRVILMGILRTGLFSVTFFFSLSGAVLSVVFMSLFKKTKLSIIGVSVIGSVMHGVGQLIAASFLLKNSAIINYVPVVIIFSIPTGIIVGIIGKEFVKHFKND